MFSIRTYIWDIINTFTSTSKPQSPERRNKRKVLPWLNGLVIKLYDVCIIGKPEFSGRKSLSERSLDALIFLHYCLLSFFFIFCHGCVSKKSFLTRLLPRIISHHTGFSGLYDRKYHPKFSAVIAWNHRGVTILWETLDQITFVVFWAGSIRFLIARDLDENIARGLKILIGKHNGLNAIARLSFKKGVLKRYKIIQFLCNRPQGFQKLYP